MLLLLPWDDQQPRTKEAATMSDENERSVASAGSVAIGVRHSVSGGCQNAADQQSSRVASPCA